MTVNPAAIVILDGVEYHEIYCTEIDVEGYNLSQLFRENGIDVWTGGRAKRWVVLYVPIPNLERALSIRRTVLGS